mmetsp:Transcript_23550/g.51527  ORF Transcript_23550/g.51527 Transcript_23550/m.51527 type:complete len:282 (-) Transcript_23550:203-1048(-)
MSCEVGSSGSYPAYLPSPSSSNRMVLATMLPWEMPRTFATGSIMMRNPPLTKKTSTFLECSVSTNCWTPGVSSSGCASRQSRICWRLGSSNSRRASRASWNFMPPSMAAAVSSATSRPLPKKSARTSIPSSLMTVLSTSKQTASASNRACMACGTAFPSEAGVPKVSNKDSGVTLTSASAGVESSLVPENIAVILPKKVRRCVCCRCVGCPCRCGCCCRCRCCCCCRRRVCCVGRNEFEPVQYDATAGAALLVAAVVVVASLKNDDAVLREAIIATIIAVK